MDADDKLRCTCDIHLATVTKEGIDMGIMDDYFTATGDIRYVLYTDCVAPNPTATVSLIRPEKHNLKLSVHCSFKIGRAV